MKYLFCLTLLFCIQWNGNGQTQLDKNKEFIKRYYAAISGKIKTPELLSQFIKDSVLSKGITSFDSSFPKYSMTPD